MCGDYISFIHKMECIKQAKQNDKTLFTQNLYDLTSYMTSYFKPFLFKG